MNHRPGHCCGMHANGGKIKLTAYEFMSMMGAAGDSHLSTTLKESLDKELAKAAYKGLDKQQAFGKAARHLSLNQPEAFEPANRDDAMLKKLAPLIFLEDGTPRPRDEVVRQVQFDNVRLVAEEKGDRVDITLSASDLGDPPMTARFSARAKRPR